MMNNRTKVAAIGNIEKNLFYMFLVAAILLLGSYLFFVQRSVFNIVARQQAERQISMLETKVASMEAEYLDIAGRQINSDYAHSLGFKDATQNQNFAVQARKTITLSLSSNEI